MKKVDKVINKIVADVKKRQSEPCKHGFGLTPRTCAYCKGYPVSNTPRSVGLAYIGNLHIDRRKEYVR